MVICVFISFWLLLLSFLSISLYQPDMRKTRETLQLLYVLSLTPAYTGIAGMFSEPQRDLDVLLRQHLFFFLTLKSVRYCCLSLTECRVDYCCYFSLPQSKQGLLFLRKYVAALCSEFDWPCPCRSTLCSTSSTAHGLSQIRCWGRNWFHEGRMHSEVYAYFISLVDTKGYCLFQRATSEVTNSKAFIPYLKRTIYLKTTEFLNPTREI